MTDYRPPPPGHVLPKLQARAGSQGQELGKHRCRSPGLGEGTHNLLVRLGVGSLEGSELPSSTTPNWNQSTVLIQLNKLMNYLGLSVRMSLP